jgi:type IV secretion system protein VirB11
MRSIHKTAVGAAVVAFNESSDGALLRDKLQPLGTFLADPAVQAICINRPGEVFSRTAWRWKRHEIASLSMRWCEEVVRLVSICASSPWDKAQPFLAAVFPSGEQIQIVAPPAVAHGTLSITIDKTPGTDSASPAPEDPLMEQRLRKLMKDREFWAFYSAALAARKNVVIADPTGSGSAIFGQTFTNFFVPADERIVVIGTAGEFPLPGHRNRVHVSYPAGSASSASALVQACRRMKPDRVLLTQMLPEVAHAYLTGIASNHHGCITAVQAISCDDAFERMADAVQASEGQALRRSHVMRVLRDTFEVAIQFHASETIDELGRVARTRRIDEVSYSREALS